MTHTRRAFPIVPLIAIALFGCGTSGPPAGTTSPPTPTPQTSAATAAAPTATPTAEQPLPLDPTVIHGALDNGLTYYIRRHNEPKQRAELRLVVNAGSVLEDDDQRGLAHFVEHMAFNGTENFAKQEIVDYMESIGMRFGADLNAYTSFDETVYMLTVPTDDREIVETGFQILADWAHRISFEDEEIEKERGVMIEEWRLGRGAQARIFDKQAPVIFKGARYADRLVIGTLEVLQTSPHEVLRRFYQDWYRPDLMAVVAVGDFDAETIEKLIASNFGQIPARHPRRPRKEYGVPDHEGTRYAIATDPEATYTRFSVINPLPRDDLVTAADYRRSLVQGLHDTMLSQRLQERTREADPPYLGAGGGKGSLVRTKAAFSLGAAVREGGLERGLEAVMIEAERAQRFGFTETELERAKSAFLRSMEQAYRERDKFKSRSFASEYVQHFLTRETAPGIEAELELAQRYVPGITLEEVNALSAWWHSEVNRIITASGPQKEGVPPPQESTIAAIMARAAAADIDAYDDRVADQPLMAAAPAPVAIMFESTIDELGVTEWRLANGARVVFKPTDFKNDEILFTAFSPGGSSLVDDADYVAAATATAVVTEAGVGDFDLIQLQKLLADKVVSVQPYISELEEGISGGASPEDLETMFQLIHLYVTTPRRSEQAFSSVRQRQRGFVENRLARPESVFSDRVTAIATQDHFRRRPWSLQLIDEMDLDTSFEVYQDRFADTSDFTYIFVGNVTADQLRPLVESYLGSLPSKGREESWRDVGVRSPQGVVEETVVKGIEPKSRVMILFPHDFEWTRHNRFDLQSTAEILRIRLREVLREDEGGTYGVGVNASTSRYPREMSTFSVSFGCSPDRVDELIPLVYEEIRKLQEHGPRAQDVAKVQQQDRRSREVQLRENGFWLSALESYLWHDQDPRLILQYDELVDGLTADAIQETAQRWIDFDRRIEVVLMPETGVEGVSK
jgi:zinc protease